MVSQLSARLLASRMNVSTSSNAPSGYASSGSYNSSKSASSCPRPHAPTSSSIGGSSGYAADYSASPALPDSINFREQMNDSTPGTKRAHVVSSCSSSSTPALKRLRTAHNRAELDHMALHAKFDIEKGGLSYPKLQTHRPRMFPPKSGVNMSNVSLLPAQHCLSPFLLDKHANTKKAGSMFNHYMESPHELISLLQSTSSYYRLSPEKDELPSAFLDIVSQLQQQCPAVSNERERESSSAASDSESSTSSFTVSDVGHHHHHSRAHSSDGDSARSPHASLSVGSKQSASPKKSTDIISIGEALSICRRPRIIALSKAPYNVVQVNAAFLRLTHSKSTADFLGKPLQEVIDDETVRTALQQCGATMQKVATGGSSSWSHHRKITRISITPVGTTEKKITHFSLKFSEPRTGGGSISSSISTASSLSSRRSMRTIDATAINVMG